MKNYGESADGNVLPFSRPEMSDNASPASKSADDNNILHLTNLLDEVVRENLNRLNKSKRNSSDLKPAEGVPPNYKTTRMLDFNKVVGEFGLNSGPVFRLVSGKSLDQLPSIAVVHCSHVKQAGERLCIIGRTLFIPLDCFENWLGKNDLAVENQILSLLLEYLTLSNSKPI